MKNWAQFRTDFLAGVQAVVPGHQVVWRDKPQPFKKPNVSLVIMNMASFPGFGQFDEERFIDDPNSLDNLLRLKLGWRQTTINFRIETHEQTDIGVAINTGEQIANDLRSFNDQSSFCG